MNRLLRFLTHPAPHVALVRRLLCVVPLFSSESRIEAGAVTRPHYAHCLLNAARLARRLGHKHVSAIEFGVAGGQGLVDLERHADAVEKITGVQVEIYGFDSGSGLPAPCDYRDVPYRFKSGFYRMDEDALRARLKRARLVIGDVRETCRSFFSKYSAAPIGCIFNDLDYYSSTRDSFRIFDGPPDRFLPRVLLYFDDVVGTDVDLYNDFTGERLAIAEFNQAAVGRKIARTYHLWSFAWGGRIFVYHHFQHPQYCSFVDEENQELPLARAGG